MDEDVNGTNENEEEDRPKKTKELMPKYLSFAKVVVGSNDLTPLNINRDTCFTLDNPSVVKGEDG